MVHPERVLASKPDNLSLSPGKKRPDSPKLPSGLHTSHTRFTNR